MVGIIYIICNGSVLLTNGPSDVPLSGQPCDVSFAHHKVRVRLVNVDLLRSSVRSGLCERIRAHTSTHHLHASDSVDK